jgi:hypothetical protein
MIFCKNFQLTVNWCNLMFISSSVYHYYMTRKKPYNSIVWGVRLPVETAEKFKNFFQQRPHLKANEEVTKGMTEWLNYKLIQERYNDLNEKGKLDMKFEEYYHMRKQQRDITDNERLGMI